MMTDFMSRVRTRYNKKLKNPYLTFTLTRERFSDKGTKAKKASKSKLPKRGYENNVQSNSVITITVITNTRL